MEQMMARGLRPPSPPSPPGDLLPESRLRSLSEWFCHFILQGSVPFLVMDRNILFRLILLAEHTY